MALLNSLPAPRVAPAPQPVAISSSTAVAATGRATTAPPYGKRKGFIPRKPSDFGDGGAYPECHVAQYPLEMGRAGAGTTQSNAIVPVSVDAEGRVDYGAIMKQGNNASKAVATTHNALVPKLHTVKDEDLARPDDEEVKKALEDTRAIIEKRVTGAIAAAQPKNIAPQPGAAQFIKYTPAKQGPEYNSGASSRVIQMHEVANDPLEPPKFRHKKVPRGPGSPPVPVMHSPPRPVSVKDQQDWKIPPCISNWKNAKGYTIPLDKRLAADGRGLQETQINDNFAKLSEALYIAEAKAREAIESRAQIQKQIMTRDKERQEATLLNQAIEARMARQGGGGASAAPIGVAPTEERLPPPPPGGPRGYGDRPRAMDFDAGARRDDDERYPPPPPRRDSYDRSPPAEEREREGGRDETREERRARQQRDEIREERRRERERERRLEELNAHGGKRSKITRDRDRDISERVALGQANVGARTAEAMYDQRLFNQDQGLDSGFNADDSYNTYSKPLFADRSDVNLYRPTKGAQDDELYGEKREDPSDKLRTDKFRPDKGFAGAEGGTGGSGRAGGPVEFERTQKEVDEFGFDKYTTTHNKQRGDSSRGGGYGSMAAAAGGAGGDAGGSGRTRVDFDRSGR